MWIRKKDYKKLIQQRNILYKANKALIAFCYPNGNWRGYSNMKGLLEAIQPIRHVVDQIRGLITSK